MKGHTMRQPSCGLGMVTCRPPALSAYYPTLVPKRYSQSLGKPIGVASIAALINALRIAEYVKSKVFIAQIAKGEEAFKTEDQ